MKEIGSSTKDGRTTSPRNTMVSLCKEFHQLGWMTGTGGAISMRDGEDIFITPSGVLKENVKEDDIFKVGEDGQIIKHPDNTNLKYSSCFPNFHHIYKLRYENILGSLFYNVCQVQALNHSNLPHTQHICSAGLPAGHREPLADQAPADGEGDEGP